MFCLYYDKVTIRPVFNGTVPFLSCLSRCPNNSFRDAQMSRFWSFRPVFAFTVCCVRCNRTNGNIQVFAHSKMHKFAYQMHQNRCRPGRRPGPCWEKSKLEYAKAVWSPLKLNYIELLMHLKLFKGWPLGYLRSLRKYIYTERLRR